MEPSLLARLRSARDEQGLEYQQLAKALREVRDAHPGVRFLTAVSPELEGLRMICDPEEDPALRSHPGDPVDRSTVGEEPAVPESDRNVLELDDFGVWVSSAAEVRDDDGALVGMACADLSSGGRLAGRAGDQRPRPRQDLLGRRGVGDGAARTSPRGRRHRRPHRALQPAVLQAASDRGDRAGHRPGPPALPALLRPRPLQGLQRPSRARGRRQGAARCRRRPPALDPPGRPGRTLRRRGAHGHPPRHTRGRSRRGRRAHPAGRGRSRPRRARHGDHRQHRHRGVPGRRHADGGARRQGRLGHVPGQAQGPRQGRVVRARRRDRGSPGRGPGRRDATTA